MNNKTTKKTNWKYLILIAVSGIIILVFTTFLFFTNLSPKNERPVTKTKTLELTTSHRTYASLKEMLKEPDLAFAGRAIVLDNGTVHSEPGAAPEAPPEVHTEYKVQVSSIIKGKDTPSEIVISVLGGVIDETRYILEDIPVLKKGDVVMIFASKGDDGKYYPLSGGTAIAVKKSQGFKLSDSTISSGDITFNEQDLSR